MSVAARCFEWQRSWSRTGDTLRAVWAASPSEVWIVGDNGVIIRYNGSSYEYDFVGDERNPITLLGIAGQPGGEVYIVGQSGKMFRFDRTAWRAVESGSSGALSAVEKSAPLAQIEQASLHARALRETDPDQQLRFELLQLMGEMEAKAALAWAEALEARSKARLAVS